MMGHWCYLHLFTTRHNSLLSKRWVLAILGPWQRLAQRSMELDKLHPRSPSADKAEINGTQCAMVEGNGPYMATPRYPRYPRYIYTFSFSLDQFNQSCPNFVADSWLCHRHSVEPLSSFPPDPVKSAWKARLEILHPLACRPAGDGGSGEEPAEPGRKQPRFVEDVVRS